MRSLFLSDIHLGTRDCQAAMLMEFLATVDAQQIFLVGDIFDGWSLRRAWHWPQGHNEVVHALLDRARQGTRVVFIPGNHDEVMRGYLGTHFGGVEVRDHDVHVTADGRRLLVIHGDQFDVVVRNARWLAHVGDRAYDAALRLNTWYNRVRRLWGGQYWSLSSWAKQQVKHAVNFIGEYEGVLTREARRGGYDGIVCGHIHCARICTMGDMLYVNTGDWIESCTAVTESFSGELSLVDWGLESRQREAQARTSRRSIKAKLSRRVA